MNPKGLLLIQALLQAADFGTTTMLMDRGGMEMNPIMQPIVDQPLLFGAAKAIPLLMLNKQLKNDKLDKKKAAKVMKAMNLFMAAIVGNNLYQLSKTR